jgi:bacterioferritin-associated ferredoxin
MYVCLCHAVTDREIHEAIDSGVDDVEQLAAVYGVGSGCGCCKSYAQELIESRLSEIRTYAA